MVFARCTTGPCRKPSPEIREWLVDAKLASLPASCVPPDAARHGTWQRAQRARDERVSVAPGRTLDASLFNPHTLTFEHIHERAAKHRVEPQLEALSMYLDLAAQRAAALRRLRRQAPALAP